MNKFNSADFKHVVDKFFTSLVPNPYKVYDSEHKTVNSIS